MAAMQIAGDSELAREAKTLNNADACSRSSELQTCMRCQTKTRKSYWEAFSLFLSVWMPERFVFIAQGQYQ